LLQSNLADSEGLAVTLYFSQILVEGGGASLLQPILLSWGGEGSVPLDQILLRVGGDSLRQLQLDPAGSCLPEMK